MDPGSGKQYRQRQDATLMEHYTRDYPMTPGGFALPVVRPGCDRFCIAQRVNMWFPVLLTESHVPPPPEGPNWRTGAISPASPPVLLTILSEILKYR